MKVFLFILLGVVVGIAIWQLAVWIGEIRYKNRQCRLAIAKSKKQNALFLVAGGPYGGRQFRRKLKMPAHAAGDVCIDISPGAIDGHPCGIVANVTSLPFLDKVFGAALASHLLEHLYNTSEAKRALDELNRVAETVYIAYPTRQSLAAWLIPDHHLWIWQKGEVVYLKQRGSRENIVECYDLVNGQNSG